MKLIKSLLLGTAAGFAATAGVQAADLPSKKAAPVDYVRVCTIGSFTGFVIPGSDVCLKIGGFVRYQYTYSQPQSQFTYVPGVGGFSGARGFGINNGTRPARLRLGEDGRPHDDRVRPAPLVLRYAYRPALLCRQRRRCRPVHRQGLHPVRPVVVR